MDITVLQYILAIQTGGKKICNSYYCKGAFLKGEFFFESPEIPFVKENVQETLEFCRPETIRAVLTDVKIGGLGVPVIQPPHLLSLPLTAASKPLPSPPPTHTHRIQDPRRIQFKTHFLDDRKPVKDSNQRMTSTQRSSVQDRGCF